MSTSLQRVVARYLAAGDPALGPKTPLMETKIKYRLRADHFSAVVVVYDGAKKIGVLSANWALSAKACQEDVEKLQAKHPEVGSNILTVYGSEILEVYRGKHIGRAMYEAIMVEMFKQRGPFLFTPMQCGGGSGTSGDALRVWHSLARTYPSSGLVFAVLHKPTLPVERETTP